MKPMPQHDLDEILQAWDQMDTTSRAVQMAQASNLTEACRRLEVARTRMRDAIKAITR